MGKHTREQYIALLNTALVPLKMFGKLMYMADKNTGAEWLLLIDSIGNSHFMNITGFDDEHMLLDIIAVSIGNKPSSLITDVGKLMKLQVMFWGI